MGTEHESSSAQGAKTLIKGTVCVNLQCAVCITRQSIGSVMSRLSKRFSRSYPSGLLRRRTKMQRVQRHGNVAARSDKGCNVQPREGLRSVLPAQCSVRCCVESPCRACLLHVVLLIAVNRVRCQPLRVPRSIASALSVLLVVGRGLEVRNSIYGQVLLARDKRHTRTPNARSQLRATGTDLGLLDTRLALIRLWSPLPGSDEAWQASHLPPS